MADEFDTIWEAENHTLAKHVILRSYLSAWTPIMARFLDRTGTDPKQELRIFDAFAGPGVYLGGEKGSPILAIETVLDHNAPIKVPVRFTFIEENPERLKSLESQIEPLRKRFKDGGPIRSVKCFSGDCVELICNWIDNLEKKDENLGPAFFFLDQFGYSKVPLSLIQKIMSHKMCECFIFINWSRLAPYISDKSKWPSLSRAFGGDSWKEVLKVPRGNQLREFQELYKRTLMDLAGIRYVWNFGMCDEHEALTHWLFFCTNSIRGLEEMKKAMRKADPRGAFSYSDRDNLGQTFLFSAYDDEALQRDLMARFSGKSATVAEIREFVLTETPAHVFKKVLKRMKGRYLEITSTHNSFDDQSIVEFY